MEASQRETIEGLAAVSPTIEAAEQRLQQVGAALGEAAQTARSAFSVAAWLAAAHLHLEQPLHYPRPRRYVLSRRLRLYVASSAAGPDVVWVGDVPHMAFPLEAHERNPCWLLRLARDYECNII